MHKTLLEAKQNNISKYEDYMDIIQNFPSTLTCTINEH